MILLFTDFGANDLYAGQVRAVLQTHAPSVPAVDLLHDAPAFNTKASAHLLAALAERFAPGAVCLAVVDPGVGGSRAPLVVEADGRYFVGPDNGLLSVVARRAHETRFWRIVWQPDRLSASFHGRDLFAPVAAWIARGDFPTPKLAPVQQLETDYGADDLGEIIYLDHYGNAITGLHAANLAAGARLVVHHHHLDRARVFSDVARGAPFWHENSLGLAEISVNCGSAREQLGLAIGQHVMALMSASGSG